MAERSRALCHAFHIHGRGSAAYGFFIEEHRRIGYAGGHAGSFCQDGGLIRNMRGRSRRGFVLVATLAIITCMTVLALTALTFYVGAHKLSLWAVADDMTMTSLTQTGFVEGYYRIEHGIGGANSAPSSFDYVTAGNVPPDVWLDIDTLPFTEYASDDPAAEIKLSIGARNPNGFRTITVETRIP